MYGTNRNFERMIWGANDPRRDNKRTLPTNQKQIVWAQQGKRCQNCRKRLDYPAAQFGHKRAWSTGGKTTIKNTVVLCYQCNKNMGRKSWAEFQRMQRHAREAIKPRKKMKRKKRRKRVSPFGFSMKPIKFGW
ncbi:HNH endonuclease [Candidatus Micrarchaeota archaeon]|nr:HNH endonuclease [Candidatus Micrarchaeota archaeon]